jgi:hypothetical protein
LDLVPLFVALSAATRQLPGANTDINETWMRLAAEFMIQAVLEQWLVLGAKGAEKVMEAFAWGFRDVPSSEWPDEDIVNDMFCEEGLLQEVEGWSNIKQRAMATVSSLSFLIARISKSKLTVCSCNLLGEHVSFLIWKA